MEEIPWVIGDQTKVKHQLLKRYISPWMKILYDTQKKYNHKQELLFVDGFSGPGIYYIDDSKQTTCLGSPLIVAKEANKYIEMDQTRRFSIICVDKNQRCVNILQQHLDEANRFQQRWQALHTNFDDAIFDLLDRIEHEQLNTPPIFFFIDPFGFTGFPLSTLSRILKYPQVELFINLDVYDIVRFCEDTTKEQSLIDLFGTKEFIEVRTKRRGQEKNSFLVDLYCRQLLTIMDRGYVMPFMVHVPLQKKRVRYYLIHASRHFKALKLMKDVMASVSDAEYAFEAMGESDMQMSLFHNPQLDLREGLKSYCSRAYPQNILYATLEKWAYANTSGISKTIKQALMELEHEGVIKIRRSPRQLSSTVTYGAKIVYIH